MVGKYPGYSQADYQYFISTGQIDHNSDDEDKGGSSERMHNPISLETIVDCSIILGLAGAGVALYYLFPYISNYLSK